MTEAKVRRVAELLAARDDLEIWRETLEESLTEHSAATMVSFGDINCHEPGRTDNKTLHGWDGDLLLPRDIAIRMLLREAAAISEELTALGVTVEPAA